MGRFEKNKKSKKSIEDNIPVKLNAELAKKISAQLGDPRLDIKTDAEYFIIHTENKDIFIPKRNIINIINDGKISSIKIKKYIKQRLKELGESSIISEDTENK